MKTLEELGEYYYELAKKETDADVRQSRIAVAEHYFRMHADTTKTDLLQRMEFTENVSTRPVRIQDFLFDSAYQVVTWVCIALAIGGIFYFASKGSPRGVLWSIVSLICSVTIMLGIMAYRHFNR